MCCDFCNTSLCGAGVDYLWGIALPGWVVKHLILADACSSPREALSRGWHQDIYLT